MSSNLRTTTGTILAALVASTALAAPTPAQKCQSSKNMEAGRYANCRQKAEAKFALTGNGAARTVALQPVVFPPDLTLPSIRLSLTWPL